MASRHRHKPSSPSALLRGGVLVVSVGAALAVGAVPAMGADTALVTQPVSVRGYSMRVVLDQEREVFGRDVSIRDDATVALVQRRGRSVQSYVWRSDGKRFRRFRISRSGRSGNLSVKFGGAARMDMRFRARGRQAKGRMPWCLGSGRRLSGRLTGTLVLRTGTKYFGSIVLHRLRASLGRVGGSFNSLYCGSPYPLDSELFQPEISVSTRRGDVEITDDGATDVEVLNKSVGLHEHQIFARSKRQHFFYKPDFSSGRATGIGPYFRGALSYTANPGQVLDDPGAFGSGTFGTVSGHLGVRLAAPGPFTVTKGPASFFVEAP